MLALRMRVGLVVNPWMAGLAYSSSMLFFSAPSAKSLTLRAETDFGAVMLWCPHKMIASHELLNVVYTVRSIGTGASRAQSPSGKPLPCGRGSESLGGNVIASPSATRYRGFQPSCVWAAVQSHGQSGVMESI